MAGWNYTGPNGSDPYGAARTGETTPFFSAAPVQYGPSYQIVPGKKKKPTKLQTLAADASAKQQMMQAMEQKRLADTMAIYGYGPDGKELPNAPKMAVIPAPVVQTKYTTPVASVKTMGAGTLLPETAQTRAMAYGRGLGNSSIAGTAEGVTNSRTLAQLEMERQNHAMGIQSQLNAQGMQRQARDDAERNIAAGRRDAYRSAAAATLASVQSIPPADITGIAEKMGSGSLEGLDEADFAGGYGAPMMGGSPIMGNGFGVPNAAWGLPPVDQGPAPSGKKGKGKGGPPSMQQAMADATTDANAYYAAMRGEAPAAEEGSGLNPEAQKKKDAQTRLKEFRKGYGKGASGSRETLGGGQVYDNGPLASAYGYKEGRDPTQVDTANDAYRAPTQVYPDYDPSMIAAVAPSARDAAAPSNRRRIRASAPPPDTYARDFLQGNLAQPAVAQQAPAPSTYDPADAWGTGGFMMTSSDIGTDSPYRPKPLPTYEWTAEQRRRMRGDIGRLYLPTY